MLSLPQWLVATGLALATVCTHAAEPSPESRKLAAEIPLFDMHMHVYPGLSPAELEARMNRNGVRWGGGVGATTPQADIAPFKAHLGSRYFPTIGQPEMAGSYMQGGVAAMSNSDHPLIQRALQQGAALLAAREAFGYGELILNNQNSHPIAQFRRLAQVDSSVVRKMFAIAAEHGGIVQAHIEPHDTSLRELRAILKEFPQVPVVISHCLAISATPREMDALFEASPQVHCELSARTQTILSRQSTAQVFGYDFANAQWLASIEKYPDRYMVGTDVTSDFVNYDDEVRQIRNGLLARLTPATLIKVANLNAKRLMKVQD